MMVQEKCDLYKLEIYGLNQTSYSNNLLVELKQYLRNDLKLKFSNLEYNPQSQATVIFFQYKSDYDSARHVFSRKVQWRTFHFSIDSKPVEKSPTCDKKLVVPSPTSSEEKKPDPSSVAHSNNNGTKEQTSQKLEEYIQTNVPLLSVPYETQLKGKQEHVLSTYANLFKQYINFKQLHTFQTFMRTKYGEGRPFMFGGVVPSPGPDEEEGDDDPNLKTPVQVIPLRDVYNRHCFNIPKKFVTATEIIEKIIRSSGLQISSNSGNSMGVWHQVCYRLHSKITGAGTINEKVTPQLMIIFQIRPGYKLTPEIIDYISDIILDEVLSQNTVQSLGLASVYIQRNHPIPFQERTDSDEYLKIIEDHWKYLPEWLRLWGADYLEDSRMRLKVLPHTTAPATAHHYKASTQALRELLIDVTDTYTIVDINCSTGILGGSLINRCKQLKFVTFNVMTQATIEAHIELLTSTPSPSVAQCDIVRYKSSRTHYDTLACDHSEGAQCIHCAIHRQGALNGGSKEGSSDGEKVCPTVTGPTTNHVKPTSTTTTEQKIDIISKVLTEATGDKVVVIYHYNSGDDFCDDFFKLIQYNTKIEKVLFVTDSAHNLNSNLVVQCIPYVMTQVGCMDSLPHSHLYDVMILFERLEPNVSHDQLRLIEQSRVEAARLETERQETLARLRAEAKQAAAEAKQAAAEAKQAAAAAPVPTSAEVKSEVKETPVSGATNNHVNKDERYPPRHTYPPPPSHPSPYPHPLPSFTGPPPPRGSGLPPSLPPPGLRLPPYGPPAPPSPFIPRALPPSRLPPPPSYHQRQRFGPPEIYNNHYPGPGGPPGGPAGNYGPGNYAGSGNYSYTQGGEKTANAGQHGAQGHYGGAAHDAKGRSTGSHMSNNSQSGRYHESTNDPAASNKRKPPNEHESNSSGFSRNPSNEDLSTHRNKKAKMDGGSSYQPRFDHSASSSPGVSSNSHPSSVSPQVSTSSSYGGGGAGGGSFSHSSATQTGFQPYKPGGGPGPPNAARYAFPPPLGGLPSHLSGGLPPLPRGSQPPPAHSNTPHSISDLTQKKDSGPGKRYAPSPSVSKPSPNPSPKPGLPSPLSGYGSTPDKSHYASSSPYPPLPPHPKSSPKPPLPSDPPPGKDTKDTPTLGGGPKDKDLAGLAGLSKAHDLAGLAGLGKAHDLAALGKAPHELGGLSALGKPELTSLAALHPSVPYSQLSQADVLKLYEAQMAAYMPGASSADIGHLYAMQLAEAQMLQAAQAAQISSAQKLYAAQVASIEEQQKQYAMQVQAAQQAAKFQSEKAMAAEAQMMREAQLKVHHAKMADAMKAQVGLSAVGYPMSDAQKLQHNAQVQMMNDAAQHQKLQQAAAAQQQQASAHQASAQQQAAADQMRKLYEDQLMYEVLAAQHQQALALGYPAPGAGLYHPELMSRGAPARLPPGLMPMHPALYSSPMLYAQGPPGAPAGMLPYDGGLPPRPR
ncbi:hypothetical protein M8J75_000405 [Diaphorina citri]|nr:hypothetical protein M8J75_000405 [Diaphorina citri]